MVSHIPTKLLKFQNRRNQIERNNGIICSGKMFFSRVMSGLKRWFSAEIIKFGLHSFYTCRRCLIYRALSCRLKSSVRRKIRRCESLRFCRPFWKIIWKISSLFFILTSFTITAYAKYGTTRPNGSIKNKLTNFQTWNTILIGYVVAGNKFFY